MALFSKRSNPKSHYCLQNFVLLPPSSLVPTMAKPGTVAPMFVLSQGEMKQRKIMLI